MRQAIRGPGPELRGASLSARSCRPGLILTTTSPPDDMAVPELPVEVNLSILRPIAVRHARSAHPAPQIYIEILKQLPTTRTDSSERTLVACLRTNSVVRAAALAPAVWAAPYRTRYTHCVETNERRRREAAHDDWRVMYVARRRLDQRALRLLDEVRTERGGRHEKARVFTQAYANDVWDALRLESELPIPSWFREGGLAAGGSAEGTVVAAEALPRRYWAQVMMGVISRFEVMGLWARVFANPADPMVTFEQALAGLSGFFDVSIREVYWCCFSCQSLTADSCTSQVVLQLEEINDACIANLRSEGVALHRDEPGYNFWHLIKRIRDAIQDLGFRLAEGQITYMHTLIHA